MYPRLFICVALCLFFIHAIRGQLTCEHDGQEKRLADGYYQCKGGTYAPVACAADDGTRVALGATYTRANYYYLFECRMNPSNSGMHLAPVACQQSGTVIQPGETFVLHSFWYLCELKGPNLLVFKASGCVTPSGERVSANNTFKTKDFTYSCYTKADGSINSQPEACIYNGREYPPEMDIESETCWYRCQRTGDRGLRMYIMGCLEGSKKYAVGERIIYGEYVYLCVRNNMDESVTREPAGCVEKIPPLMPGQQAKTIDRKFGERWVQEDASGSTGNRTHAMKYMFECKGDSKSVFKNAVQCVYDGPDGKAQLDGGCVRRIGSNTVLQCYKGENSVYGQLTFDAPQDYENRLLGTGMKIC